MTFTESNKDELEDSISLTNKRYSIFSKEDHIE